MAPIFFILVLVGYFVEEASNPFLLAARPTTASGRRLFLLDVVNSTEPPRQDGAVRGDFGSGHTLCCVGEESESSVFGV